MFNQVCIRVFHVYIEFNNEITKVFEHIMTEITIPEITIGDFKLCLKKENRLPQSYSVLSSKLFEFCHDTICHIGDA